MAVQREQPSKKFLQILMKMACLCSNTCFSGLELSFVKIQKPQIISWALASHRKRTQVNCPSGSQAMAVQRGQPSLELLQNW